MTPTAVIICTLAATFWIGFEAGQFWQKWQDYRAECRHQKMRGPAAKENK